MGKKSKRRSRTKRVRRVPGDSIAPEISTMVKELSERDDWIPINSFDGDTVTFTVSQKWTTDCSVDWIPKMFEQDRLMEKFDLATRLLDDPWHQDRVDIILLLWMATRPPSIPSKKPFYTAEFYEFVKKIRKSTTEPLLFRVIALSFTFDSLRKSNGGEGQRKLLEYSDKAIELCDSATEVEKDRVLRFSFDGSECSVGKILTIIRGTLDFWNTLAESQLVDFLTTDPNNKTAVAFPGSKCDICQKSRQELGLPYLKSCSRCKLEFYCSEACQRKSWTEHNHKNRCRKRGEFRKGDVAVAHYPRAGRIRHDDRVHLIELLSEDQNNDNSSSPKWRVQSCEDASVVATLPADQLCRYRPSAFCRLLSGTGTTHGTGESGCDES